MDSSLQNFQTIAGRILNLKLPISSTSFKVFNEGNALVPNLKMSKMGEMVKKVNIVSKMTRKNYKSINITETIHNYENQNLNKSKSFKIDKRLSRSFTTVMKKMTDNGLSNENLPKKPSNEKKNKNPILFELNAKQYPKIKKYNVKKLSQHTLIYQSDKGLLSYKLNSTSYFAFPPKQIKHQNFQDSSNQLLLSSENTLSEFYSQSIRIQNLIRRRELENSLDQQMYKTLTNKLSAINQSIINEQSRIARSFYSL